MADENLHGLPINSLPKADELNQTDQLIAYREDDGKAYRSNVGALAEASTANIGDAFATTVQYNAGDYCIYNDTLYKFTDFKDIGSWDDSVVEKVTVADEVKSNTEKIQENTDLIDSLSGSTLKYYSMSLNVNTTITLTFTGKLRNTFSFFIYGNNYFYMVYITSSGNATVHPIYGLYDNSVTITNSENGKISFTRNSGVSSIFFVLTPAETEISY